ncbi:hypothetical protein HER32_00245 [Hymenobacter sp. BT18]|uniref:hypothetical protein n=1 Tax=Hymenobacter sp. BT18 TaxID=2835648 RepID=UPI00143EE6EE|nr:hypothetical protein [Hymenobacter sp. BT18]QIX59705.1 hypothetical protein HER32_00245 [Hymenobacter sp. BT18]
MAKSAIAGINRQSRKVDSLIAKALKKKEQQKAKEKAKSELAAKRKKLASLRK